MNEHKHTYLGEHGGKANILLSATNEDEFSITLEDEQNEVKTNWEMIMHREDAEKVIRKAAEILGAEQQGEYIRKEDVIALLNKWADGYSYIEIPTEDAIKAIMEFNPKGGTE